MEFLSSSNHEEGFLNIHSDIRKKLYDFYTSRKIPHILFYGDNGCGKKTLVADFINLIYGYDKQKIKQNTLFSICSHSKGIKHIRENLKEYSRSNVRHDENIYFKTIVLYNFENLSSDGQSALRRVIESYSNTTRFFLVLQNKQKILQPILSRFAHIFVPFPMIDGVPTNLHTYNLNRVRGCGSAATGDEDFDKIRLWCGGCGDGAPSHEEMVRVSENLYVKTISCIDVIDFLNREKLLDEEKMSNVILCFSKVKSEFRNDKMLILYMLGYIFARSKGGEISTEGGGDVEIGDDEEFEKIRLWCGGSSGSAPTHEEMVRVSDIFYNKAISCIDVIGFLNREKLLDREKMSNVMMCFHKVKGEFRNEKFLILYILDYIFFRNENISNISFM